MERMLKSRKGYQANCWGALGGDGVGVTSISRLFYRTFGEMERAVADIAAAGYDGVEFFDGNLVDYAADPAPLRRALERAGIRLLGVYSGGNFIFPDILDEELWRVERAAAVAGELGAVHLVVGGGAKRASGIRDDDYQRLADALERVDAIAKKHGLDAHYHPHLTTIVETPQQVARIFSLTGIHFCPDTAHLAAAGGDPAQLIREHAKRITYVHLKDFRLSPFAFLPLGEGELDMNGIIDTLVALGFGGWVTVELDSHPDPRSAAETSRRFIDAALARHAAAAQ
jgi:inosose dehydratase